MPLLDKVMVERPLDCDNCPFGFCDSDEGEMCCGSKRDYYTEKAKNGTWRTRTVKSPQDALEHNCSCRFVI